MIILAVCPVTSIFQGADLHLNPYFRWVGLRILVAVSPAYTLAPTPPPRSLFLTQLSSDHK